MGSEGSPRPVTNVLFVYEMFLKESLGKDWIQCPEWDPRMYEVYELAAWRNVFPFGDVLGSLSLRYKGKMPHGSPSP